MIHHLLITSRAGGVLFSKFYDIPSLTNDERAVWHSQLFSVTKEEWNDAVNEIQRITMHGDKYIVFTGVGELLVFLTGSGADDELILSEALQAVVGVLKLVCQKEKTKPLSEAELVAQYDVFSMCLTEVIHKGMVQVLEPALAEALSRGAYEEIAKKGLKKEKPVSHDELIIARRRPPPAKDATKKDKKK